MEAASQQQLQSAESLLRQFKAFYSDFNQSKVERLVELYTPDILFEDPVAQVQGLLGLKRHFKGQLQAVKFCRFSYGQQVLSENVAFVQWHMHFAHPRLRGGKTIRVPGISEIHYTQRIYYQRDSYDLGAVLYEHVPVLGAGVRLLKARLK